MKRDQIKKRILVTGGAGFIGSNLVMKLLEMDSIESVFVLDNLNDYYDPKLKEYRLGLIEQKAQEASSGWTFFEGDISDRETVKMVFEKAAPHIVINLAAQAGVRYSIDNPDVYIQSNIIGFYNILEECRLLTERGEEFEKLIFASSSSVYGKNDKTPYCVEDKTDQPVSLYAATKKSNELLAHAYSVLYGIKTIGLRFFTVYGPAGRPDMAYFSLAKKLSKKEKITLFNYGKCKRDFTYIDDIVDGIVATIIHDKLNDDFKVFNLGNSAPVDLIDFVKILAEELINAEILPRDFELESCIQYTGMQKGDVIATYADMEEFEKIYGYKPSTDLRTGLRKFAEWYKYGYTDFLEKK